MLMSVPLVMVAVRTDVPTPSAHTTALVILGTDWAVKVGDAMVSKHVQKLQLYIYDSLNLQNNSIKLYCIVCLTACSVKYCNGYTYTPVIYCIQASEFS